MKGRSDKEYFGLGNEEHEKVFKLLEDKSIGSIKQYICSLKKCYKKEYFPALVIAVSLFEISLLRLWYFIKRKNGVTPQKARIGKNRIYSEIREKITQQEWKKAFNNKINSWDDFLEKSCASSLYKTQGEKELKGFRDDVTHGKVAALRELKLDKSSIMLCIDSALMLTIAIVNVFKELTDSALLGDIKSWGLPKTNSGEEVKYGSPLDKARIEIREQIDEQIERIKNLY